MPYRWYNDLVKKIKEVRRCLHGKTRYNRRQKGRTGLKKSRNVYKIRKSNHSSS